VNSKGRPEKLTDDLKRRISNYRKGQKKKLKTPVIRENLRLVIEKQIREEGVQSGVNWPEKQIPFEIENRLPGISSIQKYLQELNLRLDTPSPLDAPWHLGTLDDYPLSAEAIHHILKVQKWMAKKGARSQVTLRLAKWISRFSKAIGKDTAWLWKVSFTYTLFEILCEISDTDPDTSQLDAALMAGGNQFHKVAIDLVMLGDIHGAAMYQHEGLGNGKTYEKWADNEYNQSEVKNEGTHRKESAG